MFSLGVNRKVKGTVHCIMQKCMLILCNCTTLQRWILLNISELNWVSDICTKYPSQGWLMFSGELILFLTHLQGKYKIMYSSTSSEHVFYTALFTMKWSLVDRTNNCIFSHVSHIYWRDNFDNLFFTDQDKPIGVGSKQNFACALQPQGSSDFPIKCSSNVYILCPQKLMGGNIFPWFVWL